MMISPELTDSDFLRRYRERLSVETMFVDLQHAKNSREFRCVIVDMHQDGVGLWSDQALEEGDQVFLSIAIKSSFVLNLKSDVKHVREIKGGVWQVGVEFVKNDPSYIRGRDALRRMENLSVEMQLNKFYEDTAAEMVRIPK